LIGKEFYIPADNPKEAAIAKWLEERWGFKKEI